MDLKFSEWKRKRRFLSIFVTKQETYEKCLRGYCGAMKNCAPEYGHLGAIKSVLLLHAVRARWGSADERNCNARGQAINIRQQDCQNLIDLCILFNNIHATRLTASLTTSKREMLFSTTALTRKNSAYKLIALVLMLVAVDLCLIIFFVSYNKYLIRIT